MKKIEAIPLQQIDLSDETFSVNYLPDLHRLRSSIEQIGMIQPVLLRKKLGRYQIISGFRRISVMKELGRSGIESRVFKEKEMEEFRFFSLSLQENLTARRFNIIEEAIALKKLIHDFKIHPDTVIHTFLPLFSLETNEKILNTYLSLAQMEEKVKTYVLKEEVSRSNIRRLSVLTSEDRIAVLSLISPLKLGENRLREILTFLDEISRRSRCAVREITQRYEIQAILSQKELTPNQKAERVKKALTHLRYPRLHQLEEAFEKKKSNLKLPFHLLLHHRPFFEGKGLKVEFQFETMEEYRTLVDCLLHLSEKKEFEEMVRGLY